jgi:hypothetical protein
MLFKNSVRTSKRTPHFTVTKIDWLTLFKEIIAVYTKNNIKPIKRKLRIKPAPLPSCRRQRGEEQWVVRNLDIGISWGEWPASRSGYVLLPVKDQQYPLDRKLRRPQIWSRHRG